MHDVIMPCFCWGGNGLLKALDIQKRGLCRGMSLVGTLENIHHNMHRIGTENGTVKALEDTQNTSNMDVAMETKTSSEKAKFCIENRQLPALGLGRGTNSKKR